MSKTRAGDGKAARYTCLRAAGPIAIDGRLDEEAWTRAERSPRFVDAVTGAITLYETRAAMLWDDEYLYVGLWLTDSDVWSTGNERTGLVWQENAIQVSIAGPGAVYELAVNPLGTALEMFYIWKDSYRRGGRYDVPEFDLAAHRPMVFGGDAGPRHPRGLRWGFFDWHLPGLEMGLHVAGTVDDRSDVDEGWAVELAFPWCGMAHLAADGDLPPKAGDVWRLSLARHQVIDQNTAPRSATWTWHALGDVDLLAPERYLEVELA